MNNRLRLLIHRKSSIYDDIVVSSKDGIQNQTANQDEGNNDDLIKQKDKTKLYAVPLSEKGFNAYLISVYIFTINRSSIYRKSAFDALMNVIKTKITMKLDTVEPVVLIKLRTPKYQYLDYGWLANIICCVSI